jgi:putative membrane protein
MTRTMVAAAALALTLGAVPALAQTSTTTTTGSGTSTDTGTAAQTGTTTDTGTAAQTGTTTDTGTTAQTGTTTDTTQTGTAAGAGQLAEADQTFVEKVAQENIAELDLGELAKERAQSDEVKQFAQRMIDDHGKANEQLEEIAKNKGAVIPTEAGEEHSKLRAELGELQGEEFDQRYMAAMAEDHQKAVDLFQKQAEEGRDPELKSFAEQTLPIIKEHLTMAQSMVQQAQAQ